MKGLTSAEPRRGRPSLLLALYIGLSPVYWLPGIDVADLRTAKIALLVLAALVIGKAALQCGRPVGLPSGFFGPIGLIVLVLLSAPGFLQAAPGYAASTAEDYLTCFTALWTAYLAQVAGVDIQKTFAISGAILVIFAAMTVSSTLLGWPAWHAPRDFRGWPISEVGFGARRTGWSNGIALFVPTMFMALSTASSFTLRRYALGALGAIVIMASQLTVGGRAGLLASLLAFAALLWIRPPSHGGFRFALIAIVVLAAIASAVPWHSDRTGERSDLAQLNKHLRLDRLEAPGDANRWDRFSAGRLGSYQYAFDKALKRPFLGHGFGNAVYGGAEIHNLWLKLWVESGALLPIALLVGVWRSLRPIRRRQARLTNYINATKPMAATLANESYFRKLVAIIVAQGIVVSMFEPNALIGSFQATAIWWFCAGVIAWRPR
jgi:hypothetical protein